MKAVDHTALQRELAVDVRSAVDRLRNYGVTLDDVHVAIAAELGRTSASVQDRETMLSRMVAFVRTAMLAYDIERQDMADREAQAARDRPARRRGRR